MSEVITIVSSDYEAGIVLLELWIGTQQFKLRLDSSKAKHLGMLLWQKGEQLDALTPSSP